MKKFLMLLVFSLVLLTVPFSLPAYDASPDPDCIVPECIWAAATGGGTWMTEIQLTSMSDTATISVMFFYGGGLLRGPFTLTTDLPKNHSVKFNNILQTMDDLDSGVFTYYGRVGAIWFWSPATAATIQVTAKTVNGDYGKTLPGLNPDAAANSAAQARLMRIPLLVNNATYRTFTGFFNPSNSITYAVTFTIISSANAVVGTAFSKTFPPFEYRAFNPFVEAGVGTGTYDNCWLNIVPTAGGSSERGIMCFGASANNNTQDPSALIAYPWAP